MTEHNGQPILHVVVVGFHHKKGCQVEYAYPPMIEGQPVDSHEVPVIWKNLPSLALPDGAHNCDKDTVYFHLPSQDDSNTTVYGVSCYRQIDAKDIVNKSSEITRNSVQKCVCVLSQLPLYGVIEAKLEMITYAWFSEKDFSQVTLLEETYRQLCASCNESMLEGSQVFHGLSCRELVLKYRHKLVLLFKLILLERKVLVYGSPVKPVCSMLLSVLSIFPDMVEYGLKEAACYDSIQQVSPTLRNVRTHSKSEEDFLEIHYTNDLEVVDDNEGLSQNKSVDSPTTVPAESISHSKSIGKEIVNNITSAVDINTLPSTMCDMEKNTVNINHCNNSTVNKSSHTLLLDDHNINPVQSLSSQVDDDNNDKLTTQSNSGGTTPCGGIREKSENEKLEKENSGYREAFVVDSHICETRSGHLEKVNEKELGVSSMTRLESVQSSVSSQVSDDSIVEHCDNTDVLIKNPLQYVGNITHVEHVQDNQHFKDMQPGNGLDAAFSSEEEFNKVSAMSPIKEPSHNQPDVVTAHTPNTLVQKELSEDNLASTSEGTASEFGTSSNMEDLLEAEEGLDWQDDKLLLAIDSELGSPSEGLEREKKVERMDSTNSWASQASSVASDLGEASVKVISDLKNKFTSIWDTAPEDGDLAAQNSEINKSNSTDSATEIDEEDTISSDTQRTSTLPQVHSSATSPKGSKTSSPAKSLLGSPVEEIIADNSVNMCLPPVTPSTLKVDECGFPMAIFTKGVLCHPYLSLQYYDILQDVNVRGFLIGASNMLFKQKRNLLDVIIEIDQFKIDVHDESLRRQLMLTTADLRFADYLVKSVTDDKGNVFLDETEWEGGEEWLRGQFKLYLASLLITIQKGDDKLKEDFNPNFVHAYKTTNSYRVWISGEHRGLKEAPPGHPFHGQMNMQDVKMKFAHMMGNTEKGKKIMAAAGQTGKVAVQTGKVIGGALSSAKSAVSGTVTGWFSSIKKWSSTDSPSEEYQD